MAPLPWRRRRKVGNCRYFRRRGGLGRRHRFEENGVARGEYFRLLGQFCGHLKGIVDSRGVHDLPEEKKLTLGDLPCSVIKEYKAISEINDVS